MYLKSPAGDPRKPKVKTILMTVWIFLYVVCAVLCRVYLFIIFFLIFFLLSVAGDHALRCREMILKVK